MFLRSPLFLRLLNFLQFLSSSSPKDEPIFPLRNNLILRKMVSGVDKVVGFMEFSTTFQGS